MIKKYKLLLCAIIASFQTYALCGRDIVPFQDGKTKGTVGTEHLSDCNPIAEPI